MDKNGYIMDISIEMNKNFSTILAIETFLQENVITINDKEYYKDTAVAELYNVKISKLHKIVKSQPTRFPPEFIMILPDGSKVFSYGGILAFGGLLKSKKAICFQIKLIEFYVDKLHELTGISIFDLLAKFNH
jgi:hypothetical protein